MRTCIVSGSDERFAPLFAVTAPTHAAYAADLGYDYRAFRFRNEPWPPSWSKVPVLQSALEDYERVVWIDADAGFVRHAVLPHLAPVTLAHQTLRNEATGGAWKWPCCGVMSLEGDDGRWFLTLLWKGMERYQDHPWWEQAVAYDLLGYDNRVRGPEDGDPYLGPTEWTEHSAFFPEYVHDTPQDPRENPVIFHATAFPLDRRIQMMRERLDARHR
jgi:hypothetical protein